MLGDCNHEPYGLDTDRPCLFFRLAKNDKTQTVEIIPREGLLKDALPFNGHNMPPIVALRTNINKKEPVDVWCVIRAEGIDVPTKYRQENMFGTVKFELGPSLNSKHCSS
ncbi:hypothetical protein RF11_12232 [Thelohanellus kitauei]|uniref:Uncharacterized protein n=1 Tax=Thelohanellus kitauei TaxID=669202 RepID=A0A0C2MMK3_THEKT|nr:hypothetical protein RF11_12232 [Thelohanellus kitauei]